MNRSRHRMAFRAATLVLAGLALGGPLSAQDTDGPFNDGRWAATVEGGEAGYRTARVQIADFSGTWHDTSPARAVRERACAGKRFKITVQRSRTTDMEFTVWGSSVSPACPDLPVLLKPSDDGKSWTGTIGKEGRLRLVKLR